jgi:hypothetical protein
MPLALEVVTGQTTAPGVLAFVGLTPNTGNTFTIRNAPFSAPILLIDLWSKSNVAGEIRLRSPRIHDNVKGIHHPTIATEVQTYLPERFKQPLVPQDLFIFEMTGSGVAGNIELGAFLVYYTDLPGVSAHLISEEELMSRMVNLLTVKTVHAVGVTGNYSGEVAINSTDDLLMANTDYAVLGASVTATCLCVGLRGPDTGNIRVAIPGSSTDRHYLRHWFLRLARRFSLPMIPVFNSANKAGTLVDAVQDQGGAAVTASWNLAQLAPGVAH